ncbi:terpenoid synthase [Agrocybe pediades]|nr:terpenoid synthase [Agrocybe pediades]
MTTQEYLIPDLLREWPWERKLHPSYPEIKAEVSAWIESLRPFSRRGQKAYNDCDFNLLASLTYSAREAKDFLRVGCDLMNFYFVYDEFTDISHPQEAEKLAEEVIRVMSDESKGLSVPAVIYERFWSGARALCNPESTCLHRFNKFMEEYLHSVTQESIDREEHNVSRTLDDYLDLRRRTSAGRPTLILYEFGLNLPEEVVNHPIVESLITAGTEMIICVNDMHSFVRENACGFGEHNIITHIMRDHNLDLQGAFDWLDEYANRVIQQFLSDIQRLPSWGPAIDSRVRDYVDGIGQWVRGNDDWSCEAKRYYGEAGMKVKETRRVNLARKSDIFLEMVDTSI